jgi:hypothetical protein
MRIQDTGNISHGHSRGTPGVFYTTYSYNHVHRLRLERLLYLELSRNTRTPALLGPGGGFGFTSETFQKAAVSEVELA